MSLTLLATLLYLGLSPAIVFGQDSEPITPIVITGTYGTITSDEFPLPYGPDIAKTWEIRVREGYRVHIYFTTFDLEDSYDEDNGGACAYDYVQIEGFKRFCGNPSVFPQDAPRIAKVFKSQQNIMRITFVSDYSNDAPLPFGFEAHWTEEDIDECFEIPHAIQSGVDDWDQILYCNHFCNNIPSSYYCSCRPGFTLSSNQHTCIADCETEVTAVEQGGFIESTDYPKAYGKLSDCETTLQAGVGMRMDVRFDDVFGIEEHYEEGCVYDWLELTDHQGNSHRYCGEVAPNNGSWIVLDSNPILIHFFSDLVTEGRGYKMHYRTYRVRCNEVLQAPGNGSITSIPEKEYLIYEDEIRFACDRGFRMEGSPVSTCNEFGEWSSPTPICNIKYCQRPDELLSVPRTNPPAFEETERPFNSILNITCLNIWYELVSGANEWFCDDDETWHVRGQPLIPNENNNYPECRAVCGIKNTLPEFDFFQQFITGGRSARYGEWPWMAFIDIGMFGIERDEFCGGSLVDEQYVVTAAHCIRTAPDQLRVYLGVTDRFNISTGDVQVFSVLSATRHSGFADDINNPNNLFDNDIAVIKLNQSAVIGRYVRPICIPRSPIERDLPEDDPGRGVVAGWGITELGSTARVLQLVRVPYVNTTYCMQIYEEQSRGRAGYDDVMVTNNQFCAGYLNLARDSCRGDSGGPLMWRNGRRWMLNGIVSFGTTLGSCRFFVIGVYTKVANYMEFLDNNILLPP